MMREESDCRTQQPHFSQKTREMGHPLSGTFATRPDQIKHFLTNPANANHAWVAHWIT